MSLINNNNSRSTCAIKEGSNIIFYINLSGFPLSTDAISQMWDYAKELQPDATEKIEEIKDMDDEAPDIALPQVPYAYIYNKKFTNYEKIDRIQRYIDELQYNHTGLQFFDIRKDRPLVGLVDVAKKIIDDSLPIKCLEAVILSIYLTNEIGFHSNTYLTNNLEKFTIGFKTSSKNNIHRHVVLGIYCHVSGLFGALGTSRRSDLGSKPLAFKSLTSLLVDFVETYGVYLHKVKRVKIGMPLPYSNRSFESIQWNGCTISMSKCSVTEWSKVCEKHARVIRLNPLNTSVTNPGLQASQSLRNLSNLYGPKQLCSDKGQKGGNSKLNKSTELSPQKLAPNVEQVSNKLPEFDIHNEDTGECDVDIESIENKLINEINENQQPDLILPKVNSTMSCRKSSFQKIPSTLTLRDSENDLRSSLNYSRQSNQTTNSAISLLNKEKKLPRSLRI